MQALISESLNRKASGGPVVELRREFPDGGITTGVDGCEDVLDCLANADTVFLLLLPGHTGLERGRHEMDSPEKSTFSLFDCP